MNKHHTTEKNITTKEIIETIVEMSAEMTIMIMVIKIKGMVAITRTLALYLF